MTSVGAAERCFFSVEKYNLPYTKYLDAADKVLFIKLTQYFIVNSQMKICETTIPDKISGTKWSNPAKLDRKRKVWYVLLHILNCYWQSLNS